MAYFQGNNIDKIDDDTLDMELDGSAGTLRIKPSQIIKLINTVKQVYTGLGFNSSVNVWDTGIIYAHSDVQSHEFTAFTPAELNGKNYIKINISVNAKIVSNMGATSSTKIKIETKETGEAYAETMPYRTINNNLVENIYTQNIIWYHTLTAGEKTNGVQIKITSGCWFSANGGGGQRTSSVTNQQTVITPKV